MAVPWESDDDEFGSVIFKVDELAACYGFPL